MDSEGEKSKSFYAVLGLKKECTATELTNAYKKLARKWHPDRCSMSGNVKQAEEAKTKFQAIQEAYSVLSDSNKRFLYDCGVYNCEDEDDQNVSNFYLAAPNQRWGLCFCPASGLNKIAAAFNSSKG